MKRRKRLWTYIIALILCLVTLQGYPITLDHCYAESITVNDISISWENGISLVFGGTPNETKSGNVIFIIKTGSKCKRIKTVITGTAFNNDSNTLDTEYRMDGESTWHKAGEPIIYNVMAGKINRLYFRATTGRNISSQEAGSYRSKVSVRIITTQ